MQNNSMRVRGSFGLKLASEFKKKGSDLIVTDSSATARVELAETLKIVGASCGAADAIVNALQRKAARPAHTTAAKHLREAKTRFLIG